MAEPKRDPVCGMEIDRRSAVVVTIKHQGREYWFCSPECRDKFKSNPALYGVPAA